MITPTANSSPLGIELLIAQLTVKNTLLKTPIVLSASSWYSFIYYYCRFYDTRVSNILT